MVWKLLAQSKTLCTLILIPPFTHMEWINACLQIYCFPNRSNFLIYIYIFSFIRYLLRHKRVIITLNFHLSYNMYSYQITQFFDVLLSITLKILLTTKNWHDDHFFNVITTRSKLIFLSKISIGQYYITTINVYS